MDAKLSAFDNEGVFNEYCSQCSFDGEGTVYDRNSIAVWKYKASFKKRFPLSLLEGPAPFSFRDMKDREQLIIVCNRRYPFARFSIFKNSAVIGSIRQKRIFLNKYSIHFFNKETFYFDMPFFSVNYQGVFDDGTRLQVRVFRKDTWYFKIPKAFDNVELISILAFIHRERQRA